MDSSPPKFADDPPPHSSSPSSSGRNASPWGNLRRARLIWMKGGLFVVLGCLSFAVLFSRLSDWTEVALLAITVWAFCRAYYFAFYVIEHYVDSGFRFDGLTSFFRYVVHRHRNRAHEKG